MKLLSRRIETPVKRCLLTTKVPSFVAEELIQLDPSVYSCV